MAKTIGIGYQDFSLLREKNYFYIDKTNFIREWWENGDQVTLITRPRRFGKTLNMSMIEQFFSVDYAGRKDLFEGLSIWDTEAYHSLQGTYPVISISFANAKESNYRSAHLKICQLITELYNKYGFLKKWEGLEQKEKEYIDKIDPEMEDYVATTSLNQLSGFLSRYYGKKVILLLDEYDTPMQEAYVNGYWKKFICFSRSLFHSTFKTNPYLERGLMTGITRISRESVFSDLNNLKVVTTTSNEYADCFGFTEAEVFAVLDEYGMSEQKYKTKYWYDGFTFGGITDIYNPWSVINLIDTGKFAAYWANTSSNNLAGKLIQEASPDVKMAMEELLKGGSLCTEIDEQIIFDQLDRKKSAIWSFLLASGYLKVENYGEDEITERPIYELKLTNREVKLMFESMIRDWFSDYTDHYNDFIRALLLNDVDAMNEYMNRVALDTFSSFDAGKKPSESSMPERFYHGFVLGLMVDLAGRFDLTSNRESGFGRYDIALIPKKPGDYAYLIEFKVHNPHKEKTMEDTLRAALGQIKEKKYEADFIRQGISPDRIKKYGFAFQGKKVLIG